MPRDPSEGRLEGRTGTKRSSREQVSFGLGRSLLYSTILVLAVLLGIEGALRVWVYFFRDTYERWDPSAKTFVLVPGVHRLGNRRIRINSLGLVGPELLPDGPDLWRIYALGDSCTFGGGSRPSAYPGILEAKLRREGPAGWRYEVVNAGVEGLDSVLALRRLRALGPRLEPDVVTIYIGWNDLMKHDPSEQQVFSARARIARALDGLWTTRALRKLLFYYLRPRIRPPATGPASRSGRFESYRPQVYEANLRAIVAEARRLGARPVLLTLPTVLRPWMDRETLRRAHVVFPYFTSAYAVGDFLDLLRAYNRVIRRVALEERVPLADAEADLGSIDDPTPYFFDTMHPTRLGHERIARLLFETLSRHRLLGPSPSRTARFAGGAPGAEP